MVTPGRVRTVDVKLITCHSNTENFEKVYLSKSKSRENSPSEAVTNNVSSKPTEDFRIRRHRVVCEAVQEQHFFSEIHEKRESLRLQSY